MMNEEVRNDTITWAWLLSTFSYVAGRRKAYIHRERRLGQLGEDFVCVRHGAWTVLMIWVLVAVI